MRLPHPSQLVEVLMKAHSAHGTGGPSVVAMIDGMRAQTFDFIGMGQIIDRHLALCQAHTQDSSAKLCGIPDQVRQAVFRRRLQRAIPSLDT